MVFLLEIMLQIPQVIKSTTCARILVSENSVKLNSIITHVYYKMIYLFVFFFKKK